MHAQIQKYLTVKNKENTLNEMEQKQNKVKAWFSQLVDPNEKIFSKQWFKSYALIVFGTLLFVISRQPTATTLMLVYLGVKVLMTRKVSQL